MTGVYAWLSGGVTDRVIGEATRRGGLDNVTAIVIRIDSLESTTDGQPDGFVPLAETGRIS